MMHNPRDRSVVTRRRRRGQGFVSIDDVALLIPDGTGNRVAAKRVRQMRLASTWKRAVGRKLAQVSNLHEVSAGRITVQVQDSGWKKALEDLAPRVIERLQQLVPDEQISALIFRVTPDRERDGEVRVSAKTRFSPAVEPGSAQPGSPEKEDLREQLHKVASRYLALAEAGESRKSFAG